jgi:hypothetical protein
VVKRLGRREVVADFTGGQLTSDAGVVLVDKVDEHLGLLDGFAELFSDYRKPESVEHGLPDLLRQRVYSITCGYEDLNDHDELSRDPLLAAVVGKCDPTGQSRRLERDRGRPLAGKSTLNRLELGTAEAAATDRYKKVGLDMARGERFFAEHFVRTHRGAPECLVLDFDATDDPLHGEQEGRFFSGYYREYVYLPLYVFCDGELLLAKLRPGGRDASEGTVEVLKWLVPLLRERWPKVRIIVRADADFARDPILSWCEDNRVDYAIGLGKNSVLVGKLEPPLVLAKSRHEHTGRRVRVFADLRYRTQRSWSRARRVIGKAEYTNGAPNPRFVVTSLARYGRYGWGARRLYEQLYCARGDMENRIKEQQGCLFADRTSTAQLASNQIRLWFSSLAYVLMHALRRDVLANTPLARAQCDTLRLRLLKIGALVTVTFRRVWVRLASCYPLQSLFLEAWRTLESLPSGPAWVPQRC